MILITSYPIVYIISIPILTFFSNKIKPIIFWFILIISISITRTNFHYRIFIISLTIVFLYFLIRIILTINCFKPNMISPTVWSVRETYNYIITTSIISSPKNILIQNWNYTFNCSRSLICWCWLQFSSNHHNITNWFTIISTRNFIISRPFLTNIFSIKSIHHKIIICPSINNLRLDSITIHRRMLSLIIMPCNKAAIIIYGINFTWTRIVSIIISVPLCSISI